MQYIARPDGHQGEVSPRMGRMHHSSGISLPMYMLPFLGVSLGGSFASEYLLTLEILPVLGFRQNFLKPATGKHLAAALTREYP